MYYRALQSLARERPDHPAVVTPEARLSRAELMAAADASAARLHKAGLQPGDIVGVSVRDEPRHLVASLALMRLGCPHVVLPTHEPRDYREALARRLGAVAVLSEDNARGFDGIPALSDLGEPVEPKDLPPVPGDDAIGLFVASSASTGRAKLIPLTYRQLHGQSVIFHDPSQGHVYYRPTPIEFNNSKRQRFYTLGRVERTSWWIPGRKTSWRSVMPSA